MGRRVALMATSIRSHAQAIAVLLRKWRTLTFPPPALSQARLDKWFLLAATLASVATGTRLVGLMAASTITCTTTSPEEDDSIAFDGAWMNNPHFLVLMIVMILPWVLVEQKDW